MTTVENLVAKLQRRLVALGDGGDAKSENERAAYRRDYDALQRTISGLRNVPDELAKLDAQLADCETRRAVVLEKQASIEQQIAEVPDWQTIRDARERDREYDRQRQLLKSLELLHAGKLLIAPGVAAKRVADLDARIAELTTRRNRAQAALDVLLKDAEALLAETVTS